MRKMLILPVLALLVTSQAFAAGGNQAVQVNGIADAIVLSVDDNGAALTVDAVNLDIRDLTSTTDSVAAVQSGDWNITTVTTLTGITNVVHVDDNSGALTVDAVDLDIRTLTVDDVVSAVQSGPWNINALTSITNAVTVTAIDLDIRNLGYATDSVKIYGDQGVPFKQDSAGQIYAISSSVSGDAIEKAYAFANIATGSWIDVGSYTVSTAKNLKICNVKTTSGYDMEFKVSDGTALKDIYLQTAPANPTDSAVFTQPGAKTAGTIVTVYAKATDATNVGTARISAFEYTP